MNDPNSDYCTDDLIEDLQTEFMELIGGGDMNSLRYAMEVSDNVNASIENIVSGLLRATETAFVRYPEGERATPMALWMACARRSLLDVVEKDAAPSWAERELPGRVCEYEEFYRVGASRRIQHSK